MLVSPFIVLGFNACFAFGIKMYSFLCQEIKNPIVFRPKLFQDPLCIRGWLVQIVSCSAPLSGAFFVRAVLPQYRYPERNGRLGTRNLARFTGTLNNLCGLPPQTPAVLQPEDSCVTCIGGVMTWPRWLLTRSAGRDEHSCLACCDMPPPRIFLDYLQE